jgi:hypothetical protein
MATRGPGAAGRIRHLERLLDNTWKIADYWKVRALRAEGHDIPERHHPGLTLRDSAPPRDLDRDAPDSVHNGGSGA